MIAAASPEVLTPAAPSDPFIFGSWWERYPPAAVLVGF
jgi:hypothetical protein